MPLPSRRLLALLGLAALLFLLDTRMALALDVLVLLVGALDWTLTGGPRRPSSARRMPTRIARGANAQVQLEITSAAPFGARVHLIDDLPPELERHEAVPFDFLLPARAAAHVTYAVTASGRGDVVVGDIHMRVLGPLGLVWREVRERRTDPVRIQPGVLEMHRYRLLGIHHRLRLAGIRNIRQRGEGHSFESLREYVRGDDPRGIDWKATARHGDLMVRQYEAERSQNVLLAIDAGRLMLQSVGDRERLDHALSAALLLADVAAVHGDRVGLFVFADRVQQFLPPRRASIPRIADALARVQPRMVEPNYPVAFAFLARQVIRRSLIVLFTDLIDAEASESLVTHVSRSAQRHLTLAVALRNPLLAARADAPALSEADAYRRAAAEEMLQARARALATMRHAGVQVIDANPNALVTEVVNKYLDVKYRGLI
jgi:uncharacterized protein (DUF58 family)